MSTESTSDQQLPHAFPSPRNSQNVNSTVSGDTNTHINYITVNNVVLGEPHALNGGTRTVATPEHAGEQCVCGLDRRNTHEICGLIKDELTESEVSTFI